MNYLKYILLLLLLPHSAFGQDVEDEFPIAADSVLLQRESEDVSDAQLVIPVATADSVAEQAIQAFKAHRMHRTPDPTRALWLALVIPGGACNACHNLLDGSWLRGLPIAGKEEKDGEGEKGGFHGFLGF